LYERRDVRAALATYDFGSFFQIVRAELALTQEQFGLLVGLAQSRVSKVESGSMRLRDIEAVARMASAVGLPAQLLAFTATAPTPSQPLPLDVAIAVVRTDAHVLMVCRREPDPSGITWQFPAGIIKPGASANTVAVRETLAETGIHCSVRSNLGVRLHPWTGVRCEYFL
jgi:transcriptional regulator with XRE-family HTH domain